ncbi:hypothetical protein GCM10018966_061820 [Streptomyces yanii]
MLGLLSDLPRKNCWTIAEWAGEATPDGMQHLLNRAKWDADAVRDDLCGYVAEHLHDDQAVLVVDETGDLKLASPATAAAAPIPQQDSPAAPALRPAPSDGYRRALEAHRAVAPPSRVDPAVVEAMDRQNQAMRGCPAVRSPSPMSSPRMRRPRSSRPAHSAAAGGTWSRYAPR